MAKYSSLVHSNIFGRIFTTGNFIVLMTLVNCSLLFSQDANFTAQVDKNSVVTDEQFTLEFVVSTSSAGNPRNFRTPDLSKFLVLSGPNQSTSMQIVNGSVSSTQSFSYILQPREAGKFTIGSATIDIGGKQHQSNQIELTVTKGIGKPKQQAQNTPQDASTEGGDNVFLRAVVDRTRIYQGEQITVSYKIYTRARIVNYGIKKLPTMTGFWGEDMQLPQQVSLSNETVNGKQYQVGTLKKTALFSTQSGMLEINSMEITCQVQIQTRRRSNDVFDQFFNDPFFGGTQTANIDVKSLPVKITVLPLPVNNIPESFHGAVGKFSLNASLTKRKTKTNEPISLKAVITGTGNVKVLEAPKLNLPQDFEMYDPKVSENILRDGSTISGTKTFEWLIVPRYPGEKKIPALVFSYFDVNKGKYVTLKSNEFTVFVEQGSAEAAVTASGFSKEDVKLLNADIRFIKTDAGNFSKRGSDLVPPTLFTIITVIPFLTFVGILFYKRKEVMESSDVVKFRSRRAVKLAEKRLKDAKLLLASNNTEAFYLEISRALWQYVSDKLGIDRAELSVESVINHLQEKNISEALVATIKSGLETCEFARFAPGSSTNEEKHKMYDTASNIIIAVEKELL